MGGGGGGGSAVAIYVCQLDGGRECLYNMGCDRGDYPFWVSLWWQEPFHFRLAELRPNGSAERHSCFWPLCSLPPEVSELYNRVNRRAEVGQPARGGVS